MAKLCAEGVVICATFVFNAAQAVIAAKAGAAAVRVTLGDLEAYGQSGAQALGEIKNVLEAGGGGGDGIGPANSLAERYCPGGEWGGDDFVSFPSGLRPPWGWPL